MKYYVLASGSKGNCTLIEHNGLRVLIDCGTTKRYLLEQFAALRLSLEDIDAVLVTHDHSDHTKQIKLFRSKTIYTPAQDAYGIRIEPYAPFTISDLCITPIQTSHDADDSVGYVIAANQQKLVYITDTGYVREHDYSLISGADYYILESNHDPELLMKTSRPYVIKQRILSDSGHLSNEDAAGVLSRIVTEQTKEIVLAHLSMEANTEELALKTSYDILQNKAIRISVAKQYEMIFGGE